MNRAINLLSILLVTNLVFLGCSKSDDSSSSSSSEVSAASGSSAISLSSKVSVVEPKTTASTNAPAYRTANAIDATGFAATAEYNKDDTTTFVYEESAEPLDLVNNILCQIKQGRPDLMLNEGNYKAQIDGNKCQTMTGDSQSNAPSYDMWVLNGSRTEGEPMVMKAWVPQDDGTIHANMKVYQPPSTDYPMGFFKMNFKKVGTNGTEGMKGYMNTSKTSTGNAIEFYNPIEISGQGVEAGQVSEYSVRANFNTDGSGSGVTSGFAYVYPDGMKAVSHKIAYNSDYFYKQKTLDGTESDAVCLDRNKYLTSAWRYGLYDSDGARVTVNSGFPITSTASDGTIYNGYIGYHGLWMPSAAGVSSGDTVKKMDFSNPDSEGTDYTVRTYGGKLLKYTKNTITLDSIKGVPFSWWDNSANTEKRVYWDGSNLKVNGQRDSNWQWTDITEATLTLTWSNAPYGFNFWSRALGGDGQIVLAYPNGLGQSPTAPSGSSTVIFNTQEVVFPGDTVPSTLACYGQCPNPSTLATGDDSYGASTSIYHGKHDNWLGWDSSNNRWTTNSNLSGGAKSEFDNASAPSPYTYTFTATTSGMVLQYGGTDVVLSSANSNLDWGARSGILFDNSTFDNDTSARQADFASLLCSWDTTKMCPWQARGGLSTFYIWETGTDDWQKLSILESGGTPLKFDPPMLVKYTHPTTSTSSNSGKSYAGASFYLEYGGFGDLWGVPEYCVNTQTGAKSDCAMDGSTRWVNEFVIAAGSAATNASNSSVEYVIKPLEIEQTLQAASSASVCTDAGLSFGNLTLPDSSLWSDPAIGDKPTVSGPPTIVSGDKPGS